jgi:hypothetical protein
MFIEEENMVGLLSRQPRPVPRPYVRLALERLEDRDAPATLTMDVTYGEGRTITLAGALSDHETLEGQTVKITGQASGMTTTDANGQYSVTLTASALGEVVGICADAIASVTLTDPAPYIHVFDAIEDDYGVWTFRGRVEYRYTEGLVVNFGGIPSLDGYSATVDADGNFTLSMMLRGDKYDNGTVFAKTTSPWGTDSNEALDDVFQTGT